MQIGYLLQAVKIAAFSAFLGLLLAHWLGDLTTATVAVGAFFALLGVFAS